MGLCVYVSCLTSLLKDMLKHGQLVSNASNLS